MSACTDPSLKERLVELLRPDDAPAVEVEAHVQACDDCARELAALRESWRLVDAEPAPPSEAVLARARAAVIGPRRRDRLVTAAVVGAAIGACVTLVLGTEGAHLNPFAFAATVVLLGAYAAGLSAATGRHRGLFFALALPGLALTVASQPGAYDNSARCLPLAALVIAGPFITTGWALLRRGVDPLGGAFWGAAMGVVGVGLFRLHCPHSGYLHALYFHTTLVPALAGVGAALARSLHPRSRGRARLSP